MLSESESVTQSTNSISKLNKPSEFSEIDSSDEHASICDIWKNGTHKLIRKAEQQTPVYLQTYTQIHSEFLHCVDNIFGTCYLWQKQYVDKIGIENSTIVEYGKFYNTMISEITSQMDTYVKFSQSESDKIIEGMEFCNSYARYGLDAYAKFMSSALKWF